MDHDLNVSNISTQQKILILAHIAHLITVSSRGTYEVGTEKVLKPELLRRFNELQHRVTASVWEHLMQSGGIPFDEILEIIRGFGKQNRIESEIEWILKTASTFRYPEKK